MKMVFYNIIVERLPMFAIRAIWRVKGCIYILYIHTQCEAPKIAKLVYNSNKYGLWYL